MSRDSMFYVILTTMMSLLSLPYLLYRLGQQEPDLTTLGNGAMAFFALVLMAALTVNLAIAE